MSLQASAPGSHDEGEVFRQELTRIRADNDRRGLVVGLAANAAILQRALPLMPWRVLVQQVAYLVALAGLLAWNLLGRGSYLRWRSTSHVVMRLETIMLPFHRRLWSSFINQAPTWHKGVASGVINAFAFLAGFLGQSWVGLLAFQALAFALPLYFHLPLQLLCTGAAISLNAQLCTSALLDNEVARGFLRILHSALEYIVMVLPVPVWPLRPVDEQLQCRRVAAMAQVSLGFLLPSLLLLQIECRLFDKFRRRGRQRQEHRHAVQPSGRSAGTATAGPGPPGTRASEESSQNGDAGIVGQGLARSSSSGTEGSSSTSFSRCQPLPTADRLYIAALRGAEPLVDGPTAIARLVVALLAAVAWACICTVYS